LAPVLCALADRALAEAVSDSLAEGAQVANVKVGDRTVADADEFVSRPVIS
jgi:hypothetical protein